MTSTTANKKEISDYLWDWALTHDDWGKLLVGKIVASENELSRDDRKIIFNYFLKSIGLENDLPVLEIEKPVYKPTDKHIELTSISNIIGVNRLAKNQQIDFSKNITVIFGDNGTGKTGYSRILKNLGFSYDRNNSILTNIFDENEEQSAIIKYKINDRDETFEWNGENKDEYLGNMSVFNNNCVEISLSDRQLIVSPIGFHLFNLITNELAELTFLLKEKINSYKTSITWVSSLKESTPQQIFINSLSYLSKEDDLIKLSSFTKDKEKELSDSKNELSKLNKDLLLKEIRSLTSSVQEITQIGLNISNNKTVLNKTNLERIKEINRQLKLLESKTQIGIKEIAEKYGIEFYEKEEFKNFIKSAEEYIKIINNPKYPTNKDNCVYCQQTLKDNALDLLSNYRILLNDKTQENISKLKKEKKEIIDRILQLNFNLVFHYSGFGMNEKEEPIQPDEIIEYNKNYTELQEIVKLDTLSEDYVFNFDDEKYLSILRNQYKILKEEQDKKQDLLKNLTTKELELKKKISILEDCKILYDNQNEIKDIIKNHKIIYKIKLKENNLNSHSISLKTSEARNELVSSNFDKLFKEELSNLKRENLNIELSFGTERGNSKVSHRINSYILKDILSEGEQKSIALAEFLTELQLDNIKAPVIFDDPVNSLDHHIVNDVAKRLIRLSDERQVIIFTHSVLLFNDLLSYSDVLPFKDKFEFKFYCTQNNYEETGFICDGGEQLNSLSFYTAELNKIINNPDKNRLEKDVAKDGYSNLRACIEVFVEKIILKDTVKRYRKNVALTRFIEINGSILDKTKEQLNDIFERSCGYILGHSNPEEIHDNPTLSGLKSDYDKFLEIKKSFS